MANRCACRAPRRTSPQISNRDAFDAQPPPSSDKSSDLVTMMFPETPDGKPPPAQPRRVTSKTIRRSSNSTPNTCKRPRRQYERAEEARANGNLDYAIELLLKCIKFDPVSIVYRQGAAPGDPGGRPATRSRGLVRFADHVDHAARVTAAHRARLFRRVLDEGEEVLVRHPGDVKIQMAMAESAKELGLDHLAVWMLTELRRQDPRYLPAQRALASIYERQGQYSDAIAVWEEVSRWLLTTWRPPKRSMTSPPPRRSRGNYRR